MDTNQSVVRNSEFCCRYTHALIVVANPVEPMMQTTALLISFA